MNYDGVVRHCINPDCDREIVLCNGCVVARDMVEWWKGLREAKNIRELCGLCVLRFGREWDGGDWDRFEAVLRENPVPRDSPDFIL
jgi:hypothetical protein